MKTVLLVGDVHATPEDLEDCQKLVNLIERTTYKTKVDEICLLGDSYHTHNVIRAEVMAFYRDTFKRWQKSGRHVTALVGNHDYAGEGNPIHSMLIHEDQVLVVDQPLRLHNVGYMPYYSDREKFVQDAGALPTPTLVCHQTFRGSMYENGCPAEDGVDAGLLPQTKIISGHIHTPQDVGKVRYIGAPRWRTLTDANVERAIWLYTFNEDGTIQAKSSIDTGKDCRQIRYVEDTPDHQFDGELDSNCDWRIDIRGPVDFVEARKALFQRPGVRVRGLRTDVAAPKIKESEGVAPAFRTFLTNYTPKYGTPTEVLGKLAEERLHV
jgi:DNA repair exonuclease SbcCD nuclease subunit